MFCKECGQEFKDDTQAVCLSCGVKKGNGTKFCTKCGTEKKTTNQDVCLECGNSFKTSSIDTSSLIPGKKTKLITLLLWVFLGGFGGHYFYVGNVKRAVVYIILSVCGFITFGITTIAVGILLIIDIINILTDKFKDEDGNIISEWQ